MAKNTATAPKLPPASVDFNKLHSEMKAGRQPETALENSIIGKVPEEPEAVPALDEPAPDSADKA